MVKNPSPVQETQVLSLGQEAPMDDAMVTHSIFLPGESHGERNLVGYSPWGCKESDTTEQLSTRCIDMSQSFSSTSVKVGSQMKWPRW